MRLTYLLAILLLIQSCSSSDYPGYSKSARGINYKFHAVGDENDRFINGDWLTLNFTLVDLNKDTLVQNQIYQRYDAVQDSGWMDLLSMLVVGDSVSAYLTGYQIDPDSDLIMNQYYHVHLAVAEAMDEQAFQFFQKYPELVYDGEIEEQVELIKHIHSYQPDSVQLIGGVFLVRKMIGQGELPHRGDEVVCHYEMRNLQGKILDSTYERKAPFSFVIGVQGQVLDGFNIGVRKMRKDGKAVLIVPSNLAFGSKGSSTQIAKEYETLVFDIEILEIFRADTII